MLVELMALVQSRLGMPAVRDVDRQVLPLLRMIWVDGDLHARGAAALLTAGKRRLSLVDCVSFEAMRSEGIRTCFTHDRHFVEQGFRAF